MIAIRNLLKRGMRVVFEGECVLEATCRYPYTTWEIPAVYSGDMNPVEIASGWDAVVFMDRERFDFRDIDTILEKKMVVICYDKVGWKGSESFVLRFLETGVRAENVSISNIRDVNLKGPLVLNVLTPCPKEWGYDPRYTVKLSRLAVESLVFPIYGVQDGKVYLRNPVEKPRPIRDYISLQERFKDLRDVEEEEEYFRRFYKKIIALSSQGTE